MLEHDVPQPDAPIRERHLLVGVVPEAVADEPPVDELLGQDIVLDVTHHTPPGIIVQVEGAPNRVPEPPVRIDIAMRQPIIDRQQRQLAARRIQRLRQLDFRLVLVGG